MDKILKSKSKRETEENAKLLLQEVADICLPDFYYELKAKKNTTFTDRMGHLLREFVAMVTQLESGVEFEMEKLRAKISQEQSFLYEQQHSHASKPNESGANKFTHLIVAPCKSLKRVSDGILELLKEALQK